MKSVVLIVVYALVLLFGGFTAFWLAPEGASKATALLIPAIAAGLMIAAAVLVLRAKKSAGLARLGVLLSIVLPVLFALAFAQRGMGAASASAEFRDDLAAYLEESPGGAFAGFVEFRQRRLFAKLVEASDKYNDQTFEQFQDSKPAKKVKTYDKAYLAAVLLGLSGASVLAVLAIASTKPTIEKIEAEEEPADDEG